MSYTPAQDKREYDLKMDSIKKCGINRGPHDYIPVAWTKYENNEGVTMLLCRVCMNRVSVKTLYELFKESKM